MAELTWLPMLMDFANDYFDCTIASVAASGLRELLFDMIPEKATIDATSAGAIIAELRAFYAFAQREYSFELADECLRLLDGGAVAKLTAALSDRRKFGMAKAIMVAGQERGFDLSTTEGVEAWMRQLEKEPLPPWTCLPSPPRIPANAKAAQAKKNKRKSERKARKKNR